MGYQIGVYASQPEINSTPGGGNGIIFIPAGVFLEAIVLQPLNADVVNLGFTPGANDLIDSNPLVAGDNNTIIIQQKFSANTIVYVSGLTAKTLITVYKK